MDLREHYAQSGNQPGGPSSSRPPSTRNYSYPERQDISNISNFSSREPRNTKLRTITPKLADDKSNLVEWFVSMEVSLTLDGLWPQVQDKNKPCSRYDDLTAWHIIYQSVGPDIRQEIAFHASSPGATIRSLNNIYGSEDRFMATRSFETKFRKLNQCNFTTPMDLYRACVKLNNEAVWLRRQNIVVTSESDIAKQLIIGLGDEYTYTFLKYFDTHDDVEVPFVLSELKSLIVRKLETEEAMRGGVAEKSAAYNTTTATTAPPGYSQSDWDAFLAFKAFQASSAAALYSDENKATKKQSKPKPKRHCTHCDRSGHLEDVCWDKYPEKKVTFFAQRMPNEEDVTSAMNAMCMMTNHLDFHSNESDFSPDTDDNDKLYDINDLDNCEWPDECKCWRTTCLPRLSPLVETTSGHPYLVGTTTQSPCTLPLSHPIVSPDMQSLIICDIGEVEQSSSLPTQVRMVDALPQASKQTAEAISSFLASYNFSETIVVPVDLSVKTSQIVSLDVNCKILSRPTFKSHDVSVNSSSIHHSSG
jgi:hypothetical protein